MKASDSPRPEWKTTTNSLGGWLAGATARLAAVSETPGLEAQVLLAHALNRPRAWVLAHPESQLPAELLPALNERLEQLAHGVPLPYLTGRQEFFGLELIVTPDVLIPRPETELLVEEALRWLRAHPTRRHAADVGTGSGCITAALTHSVSDLHVLAVERSRAALRVACQNFDQLGLRQQVTTVQGDLLSACGLPLDLVCANLPYIPTATLTGLRVTRHEPRLALDGGADGLDLIRRLLADAPRWLAPGGLILLEIEAGQGGSAAAAARAALPEAEVCVITDLAGLDRLVRIEQSEVSPCKPE